MDNKQDDAKTAHESGKIYLQMGDFPRALESFNKAQQLYIEALAPERAGLCLANMGLVYYQMDDLQQALIWFEKGIALFQQIGFDNITREVLAHVASISFTLAQLYVKCNQPEKALPLAISTVALCNKLSDIKSAFLVQSLVAVILISNPNLPANATSAFDMTFDPFRLANSFEGMRVAAEQVPLMKSILFISSLDRMLAKEYIPPHVKLEFEQRLNWLKKVAEEQ